MAARGRGGGKTPEMVIALLKEAVARSSQSAVAKGAGLTRLTVQRYLKGKGEPSSDTLQKLADYFNVPKGWLRDGGLPLVKAHNYETVHKIIGMVTREYSSIHAQNVDSILSLSEEQNYKLADYIHDAFLFPNT